jgi:hypothetical protein
MDDLDEKVLDITQRQKRAQIMRRYKAKIERSRELAQKRLAPEKNIKKRAYAQARQIVRKRFAGKRGAEYEKLGPSEKMSIDRAIEKKAGLIKKIALRLIPKVKSAEAKRLQSFHQGQKLQNHGAEEGHKPVNEQLNALFSEKFDGTSATQLPDENKPDAKTKGDKQANVKSKAKKGDIIIYNKFGEEVIVSKAVFEGLYKKAEKSGIDIETLGEVYNRGRDAWNDNGKVTKEQYAFARVNSFINQGRSYFEEDADLHGEELVEKRGLWDNIHAKRRRIKAGSGERMRKPGSKGAPTEKSLKDAQESVEIDEGVDKNHPIVKEYDSLKKHDIKTLRNMISQHHKVVDTSEFKTKDHAVSHYLRQKHGNKKVDQAFGFNEETELDEAGSKYNIPMARTKAKSAPTRPFINVVDELGIPAKHLDRARSVWNRTKDVDAVKKFVSSVKEETELDEMDKMSGSRRSFDSFKGQDKTGKPVTVKNMSNDALSALEHEMKATRQTSKSIADAKKKYGVKEETELDEQHSVHIKTYDKHGEKQLASKEFKSHLKSHGGEFHYGTDKGVAFKFGSAHHADSFHRGVMTKFRDLGSEKDVHESIEESNNKPYVRPHTEKGSDKQIAWKASNKHGRVKYFGLDFKKSAEKHAGLTEDNCTDDATIAPGTKTRRKEGTIVGRPDTKPSKMAKQKELKDKIIDEEGNSQNDPAKREVGTDSVVKAFKKDTPGQDPVLNESFNIAYSAGVGVTLTAADLGMKVKSGFELHPSVVEELKKLESEEESE